METNGVHIHNFFQTSDDLFCVVDADGIVRISNLATTSLLGYLPKELQGNSYYDLVHQDDLSSTKKAFEILLTGASYNFENRFRKRDGEYCWMWWSAISHEKLVYLIARDITNIKTDQDHLRVAQNRLRLLYEASSNPNHTLWQKIEHVLDLGNKELATEHSVIGKIEKEEFEVIRSTSETDPMYSAGQRIDIAKTFGRYTLEAQKPFAIEVTQASVYDTHPAHTELGLEVYIGVPLWVAGKVYGTLSFVSKTPRKKPFEVADLDFVLLMGQWVGSTMALLFANEHVAYNAAIVESSDDAIIGQSLDGHISSWNRGAHMLFGYAEEEAVGKHFSLIVPSDSNHEIEEIQNKLVSRRRVAHHDTVRRKKDGTLVDVSLNMSPIVDDEDQVIGVSSVIRDITKEKQVDKAKTEFVSLASHQLRTPLSAINWYVELLQHGHGSLDEEQSDYLNEIFLAQKRMTSLVNQLLNVSRIELGTFVIQPEETNIVGIAQSVVKELGPLISKKRTNIIEEYPEGGCVINVDKNLLRIIFQNIITNAIRYTPDRGEVRIVIHREKSTQNVLIRVSDNGWGIPKGQQDRIFTKLYRADNIKERETDGNGLGLYMVKSILDASGGSIRFESKENEGTTFSIDLPHEGMRFREGEKTLE